MPTIDQLAQAASASDSDELIVSQAGVTRKISRAQVLNGTQPAIAVPAASLLGRVSTSTGAPEVVAIGQNLMLSGGTLSATAAPFTISTLPSGLVPSTGDLFALSQGGTAVAVSYGQIVSGLMGTSNFDVSNALVTPNGSTSTQRLATFAAGLLQAAGGTVTGPLVLATQPVVPAHAANKGYVDQALAVALPLSGGSLSGSLSLAAQPVQALDASPKSYVDTAVASALPLAGGTLKGSLFLASDPTNSSQAATKNYVDQKISRSGDTLTGPLVLPADPVAAPQAATKNYVDRQVAMAVPSSGGTLTGALTLATDPSANTQAATKQYVDKRVLRAGDTLTGALLLAADPTIASQAATKNYVDTQAAAAVARTGSTMIGPLTLAGDPALPMQASTKQYADLKVSRNGDTLTGPLLLAADPAAPLHATTKQYVDSRFAAVVSSAGVTFTGSVVLAGDPATATQAATKQYVDARIFRSGDTLTGALTLASDPTAPTQAATKNYVDGQVAACFSASGGTITGALILSQDPSLPSQASTKRYVDNQVAATLPLTGGTLTGAVALTTSPTNAQHAATKQYVDTQVATALPRMGGTLAGALTLAALPTAAMHAATKGYVDQNPGSDRVINVALPPFSAAINGVTDDTAAFKAAYQAAPSGGVIYVPSGITVLQAPGSWGIPLTKVVRWVVDGTQLTDGTPLGTSIAGGNGPSRLALPGIVTGNSLASLTASKGSSAASDFAVQQSAYIVNHSGGTQGTVATNSRNDTIIYASPGNYIWGGLDRLLWSGTQAPSATNPTQHVARYIQTARQAANTSGQTLLPQPQLWAACLEYRDSTGQPSSMAAASLTVEMDWIGNGPDDANSRQIQSLVVGQHSTSGAPVEVATGIGFYVLAGSSGSIKTVMSVGVPFSTAVLDTTNAQSIGNAPVLRLAAGQSISLETGNSVKVYYDPTTSTVRLNQSGQSFVVGKGITVGWQNIFGSTGSIPNYIAGNIIFLIGSGAYTLTLPAASTVAAGTGYTFSNVGSAAVSIVPAGTDGIDCSPVTLRANDRYHVVSDGSSFWREIFRSNAVSPRYTAPVVLASYSVSNLPLGMAAGAKAFATNGRKPSEAAGAGTGVEVFYDGQHWISCCSGTTVVS